MSEMEFKFSKLVKIIVFRCLRANKTVGCSECRHLSKKMKKYEKNEKKKTKSVKSLRYMDELFLPTNDFSLLENCQLYIIAKYEASNCCKIEAVIQRCPVKKVVLKDLAKFTGKPLCQSLFFNKVAA